LNNNKIKSFVALFLTIILLNFSFVPAYAAVVVSHSNTAATAISIPAEGKNVKYIMSRGLSKTGEYIVDSDKWFKFTPTSSTSYEFRNSTANTNREISMYIYESPDGQNPTKLKYYDISNIGNGCSVSICEDLIANKTYFINCVSVVANPEKEPSTSNVYHEFHVAKHNHNLVYTETNDELNISVRCTAAGCTYNPIYPKVKSASIVGEKKIIYDKKNHKPDVIVKDNAGNTVPKQYYTVSYSTNCIAVGKYSAKITFKQPYASYKSSDGKTDKKTEPISCSYLILPKAEKINLSATEYTYNGKAKKPSVSVTDSSGNKVNTSYYTVAYPNGRINVGTYTVKVTFNAPYSGSKTATFKINPTTTSISKLTTAEKAFTVSWYKRTTQVTGYQIRYSTSSSFATYKTVGIASNSTTSKKITGLSAKKKYYVKVRTYKTVGDKKYYSDWSGVKTITTK